MNSIGVAVFVKTPGLSPVKTRLAEGIGGEAAERFYGLACESIRHTLSELARTDRRFVPYWAVADSGRWEGMGFLSQGPGALGARLSKVYSELLSQHDGAILIGADSPQLGVADFIAAGLELERAPFVIGPALDGGYYPFGGRVGVDLDVWESVPYSSDQTARVFVEALNSSGSVSWLAPRCDVDEVGDLRSLLGELDGASRLSSAQELLQDWVRGILQEVDFSARR